MTRNPFDVALEHHREGRLAEAERLYREILARDPAHAPALHHLGLVAQAVGRLEDACELLQKAARLDPSDAVCHNNLANVLRELQRLPEAMESYRAAVRCDPDYVNAQFNLATLLMDMDDVQGAVDGYRQVLRLSPDDTDAMGALGVALMALGQVADAIAFFRRVLALRPDDPGAHYNLATALKDQGELDAVLDGYRRAVALSPDYAEAYNNLGLLLKKKGELAEAAIAFEEAVRANSRHVQAYLNLVTLLLDRGDHARAEEISRLALKIDARNPRVLQKLGEALAAGGNFEDAECALRTALDIDPELAEARVALGETLHHQTRIADATMQFRAVPAYAAAYGFAQNNLGVCLANLGQMSAALAAYARALDADPGNAEAHSNMLFYSNYLTDTTPEEDYALHRGWARQHAANPFREVLEIDLDPTRRLRVGYVSADFRHHPVASFIEPFIKGLDRTRFEVTCYADVPREDDYTRFFRDCSDHWRDLRGLDNDKAAALVRDDRIDILIDLAGHTAGNRMPLFARRAAPIQISYLGYPNTTGLDQMDYRLTDEIADPPGEADDLHSEELVRLPGGFLCYAPPRHAPPVSDAPAIAAGQVTFGSFNNSNKVNETVVAVWSRILRGLPASKLLMKSRQLRDAEVRRHVTRLFLDHGIDESRLELAGTIPNWKEHLATYSRVDVGLDTFPYNGTTTTCEALWMGVPVVTLAGRVHRARVGASILHHTDLDDLVTRSVDAYVEKALALARDPRALTSLRRELRERVAGSSLTNAHQAVDSLQSALDAMWRRHCESAMVTAPQSDEDDAAVRLNIGGRSAMSGWKIFNAVPGPGVDYVGDYTDLSQFGDNSIDEVYAAHVIEHLGYREELPKALEQFHRILKAGGTLRISVPNLSQLCRLYLSPERDAAERLEIMRAIYGSQIDPYDFQKVGFSWESLRHCLQRAGFKDIARVEEFGIFNDKSSTRIQDRLISINVEARK